MTEAGDNYYIRFSCETEGATILYNHNVISPSYTPTSSYGNGAVIVPKSAFPSGTVRMTARAVKEAWSDAGVVTLQLTPSGAEANPETAAAFSDVAEGAWYAAATEYVMEKGLFDATGTGNTFSPNAPMTRGMLATALYRLEGSPAVTVFADFSDVTKGTPLSAAVSWAGGAGIVLGYEDGSFRPETSVTREQIAALFFRHATHKGADTSARGDLGTFSDGGRTSAWAAEALAWAGGAGLINGMGDGTLAPQGTATRAQVAQMLLNYEG
jgi:hypothetical protein